MIGDEIGNEIEHFFLPLSERHKAIVGEERGKIKGAGNYPLMTSAVTPVRQAEMFAPKISRASLPKRLQRLQ